MKKKDPKKTPEIARFKLAPELRKYVDKRAEQLGCGQAEYMRLLIRQDKQSNPDQAA